MNKIPWNRGSIIGQEFYRWTVLAPAGRTPTKQCLWWCQCKCGNTKKVSTASLRSGNSKSCGCWKKDEAKDRMTDRLKTKYPIEYNRWSYMKRRCYNKNFNQYQDYGGRGIKVCPKWRNSFADFFKDMGPLPSRKHSLERKNNDGDYEPNNCVWSTRRTQSRNTRQNHNISYEGRTRCLKDWSEFLGIDRTVLYYRLKNGWGLKKAFTTPVRFQRAKKPKQ